MSVKGTLLSRCFKKAGNIGISEPGYRMASVASLCCTVRDIFELDLDDRSILDLSLDPTLERETKERIIEVNGYEDLSTEDILFMASNGARA